MQTSKVKAGEVLPEYTGDTPKRDQDSQYFYVFNGFESKLKTTSLITYTATYKEVDYTITDNYTRGFTDDSKTAIELTSFADPYREYPEIYIPDEIQYQNEYYPVTTLANFCISSQYATKIHIGANVSSIGSLFISDYQSAQISYIDVDSSNETFKSVDGILYNHDLTKVLKMPISYLKETYLLPDTVTEIGPNSFQDVRGVRNFETNKTSTLKKIDEQAFAASLIQNVNLPDSLTYIGIRAFWLNKRIQTLEIPKNVVFTTDDSSLQFASMSDLNTPDSALSSCPSLQSVNLPTTLKSIGRFAFSDDTRVKEVELPTGLVSIGESAFSGSRLYNLTTTNKVSVGSLTLPDGVTEISDFAFSDTAISGDITIGKNITKVGTYSFYGDEYILSYLVEEGSKYFSSYNGILCNKEQTKLLMLPNDLYGDLVLPDTINEIGSDFLSGNKTIIKFVAGSGLTKIGDNAFANSIIRDVFLNEGLTGLGDSCFANTKCLNEITFPSTLKEIPAFAFQGSAINDIDFGGVTTIGQEAFYNCDDYETVDMSASKVATIGSFAFSSFKDTAFTSFVTGSELTTFTNAFTTCQNITSFDMSRSAKVTTLETEFLGSSNKVINTLILPSSLTKMSHDTLGTFPKLKDLKYTGTKEQWNTLVANSLLTKQEKIDNADWGEWFGSNYDTLTSITVNYGTGSEDKISVNLRDTKGKLA